MKKSIAFSLSLVFLLILPVILFAGDTSEKAVNAQTETQNIENTTASPSSTSIKTTAQNPTDKLGRGIINIVTSPVEIAKQVDLGWKQSTKKSKNVSSGVLSGIVKGLAYTVGRMGSGIWDVVSFPFKTPGNYEPLMKPDFVLDKESPPQK